MAPERADAELHAALRRDRVVDRRVQVQREGRRHLREVVPAEEEPRPKVDRQVRPRRRRAAEDVHGVVERAREVRVDETEAVAQHETAHRRLAVVRRVEARHRRAVAVAQQEEGLRVVELLRAPVAGVRQELREARRQEGVVQELLLAPLRKGLARVVPQQHLQARVARGDGRQHDLQPLERVEEVVAHDQIKGRLVLARLGRPSPVARQRKVHDDVGQGRVRVELQHAADRAVDGRERRRQAQALGRERRAARRAAGAGGLRARARPLLEHALDLARRHRDLDPVDQVAAPVLLVDELRPRAQRPPKGPRGLVALEARGS